MSTNPAGAEERLSIYKPLPRIFKTEPETTIKQELETHVQVPVKRELDDNNASETPQSKRPKVEGDRAIKKAKAKKVQKSKEEIAEDKAERKAVEVQTKLKEKSRLQASIEHAEKEKRISAEQSRIHKAKLKAQNKRDVVLLAALAVEQKKASAAQSKLAKEKNSKGLFSQKIIAKMCHQQEQLQLPRPPPEHDIPIRHNTRGAQKRAAALLHGVAEKDADVFWRISEEKEKTKSKISDLNQKLEFLNREIGNLKKQG